MKRTIGIRLDDEQLARAQEILDEAGVRLESDKPTTIVRQLLDHVLATGASAIPEQLAAPAEEPPSEQTQRWVNMEEALRSNLDEAKQRTERDRFGFVRTVGGRRRTSKDDPPPPPTDVPPWEVTALLSADILENEPAMRQAITDNNLVRQMALRIVLYAIPRSEWNSKRAVMITDSTEELLRDWSTMFGKEVPPSYPEKIAEPSNKD